MSDIAEKVRKLLAKANGTDVEAEREIFLAKAMELITAHNISVDELNNKDDNNLVIEVVEDTILTKEKACFLIQVIANHCFCLTIRSHKEKFSVSQGKLRYSSYYKIFGREENVKIFNYFYENVARQIKKLTEKAIKDGVISKSLKSSYIEGLIRGLDDKLNSMSNLTNLGTDLPAIYRENQNELKKLYVSITDLKLKTFTKTIKSNLNATNAGKSDSDKITLNKGLENTKPINKQRLLN